MPLYWDPAIIWPWARRVKHVPAPSAAHRVQTWNVGEWDVES